MSYPLFQEIAKRSDLFTGVIARTGVAKTRFTTRPGDRGQFTQREFVSGNYFTVLGVTAALGRLFTEDDNRTPGGHPVAVLSYDLWRNRYGADPGILGGKILVDEQPLTVIGVAAPGFHGVEVERRAEVWVPAMMAGVNFTDPRILVDLGGGAPPARGFAAAGTSRPGCADGAAPERNLAFHLQRRHAQESAGTASGSARGIGRALRVARGIRPPAHRDDGGRGAGPAGRLRQRGQPAAGARRGAAKGSGAAPFARRHARAPGAPGAHREHPAGGGRRRARRLAGRLGTARGGPVPAGKLRQPVWRRTSTPPCCSSPWASPRSPRCCSAWRPALRSTAVDPAAGLRAGNVGQGGTPAPAARAGGGASRLQRGAGRPGRAVRPQPVCPARRGPRLPQPERGRVHAGFSARNADGNPHALAPARRTIADAARRLVGELRISRTVPHGNCQRQHSRARLGAHRARTRRRG